MIRKYPIHQTAIPLVSYIESVNRPKSWAAKKLGLPSQNVFNWFRIGVPANQMHRVAALCNMSTDDYLKAAGVVVAPLVPDSVIPADTDPQGPVRNVGELPEYLRHYIKRKVSTMLNAYDAIPAYARAGLVPPEDKEGYARWEREIEGFLLHTAKFHRDVQPPAAQPAAAQPPAAQPRTMELVENAVERDAQPTTK